MDNHGDGDNDGGSSGSSNTCPICIGPFHNESYLDKCFRMSQASHRPPAFLENPLDEDDVVAVTQNPVVMEAPPTGTSHANPVVTGSTKTPPRTGTGNKKNREEQHRIDEQNKKLKHDKFPPLPPANLVTSIAGRTSNHYISEKRAYEIANEGLGSNLHSAQAALSEAHLRFGAHNREMAYIIKTRGKMEKENTTLKYKISQLKQNLSNQAAAHKAELKNATSGLQDELRDAKKAKSLAESRLEAEAKARKEDAEKAAAALANVTKELEKANGQVKTAEDAGSRKFMKYFIKKLPAFDWSPFGEGTIEYATELVDELAKEAQERAARKAKLERLAKEKADGS